MNLSIINQYQINFVNKINNFEIGGKEITKIPNTSNKYLDEFLFNWNAQEINEILLPDINQALVTPNSEIENGSETISILIYQNKVDFYADDGSYSLPTLDFKEIVIGWRDFLLTPPLNGARV
jgi:hypothetical protein